MKGKIAAWVMGILLTLYLVLVANRALSLMVSGDAVGVVMGVALFVLPVIGAWALGREFLFGASAERLVRLLADEGALPGEDLPRRASGRPIRGAADQAFPAYRDEAEASPTSWRAWFRLGLAYDASGDRRRARHAIRHAIELEKGERRGSVTG